MNKNLLLVLTIVALGTTGISYAAFADKGKILGSSFSVGSADIKFLKNLVSGSGSENLTDELPGPNFSNIHPNWSQNYLIKLHNNSTTKVQLASNANYLTVNDPDDLRTIIFVEPFGWNDTNSNGILDEGELGNSYGRKSITKWKTEGFALGTVDSGSDTGMVLKFSTDSISETKQGKSAIFDFEFDSISIT